MFFFFCFLFTDFGHSVGRDLGWNDRVAGFHTVQTVPRHSVEAHIHGSCRWSLGPDCQSAQHKSSGEVFLWSGLANAVFQQQTSAHCRPKVTATSVDQAKCGGQAQSQEETLGLDGWAYACEKIAVLTMTHNCPSRVQFIVFVFFLLLEHPQINLLNQWKAYTDYRRQSVDNQLHIIRVFL